MTTSADVTLLLEGTYPYVSGGVSTWVHQLLQAYPQRRFSLLHIGPYPGAYTGPVFVLPDNVVSVSEVYCRGARSGVSGIVTRVANPVQTAAALVCLAKDPEMRKQMRRNGLARVAARYQQQQVVANYDSLYTSMVLS